ncbi:hypothetical protein [Effusibacillus lacus]|nr:hypothetical protein [Effusibacillus lacus]TCS68955.1 hypothetical protein EDD64_13927 [Effusibacillus lacus]
MDPNIIPLFLLAAAVGAGLMVIAAQASAPEGDHQDPSSQPTN